MPTNRLKCHCKNGKKNPRCQAPLHGEITIITCPPNCGWGCDNE